MRSFNSKLTFYLAVQCFVAAATIALALLVRMPWIIVGGVTLLCATACSIGLRREGNKWSLGFGWVCTWVTWWGLLYGEGDVFSLHSYYIAVAAMVGLTVLVTGPQLAHGYLKSHWNLLGMTWAFAGAIIWLVVAYLLNLTREFYIGLLANFALLSLSKFLFQMPVLLVQVVNTLILLLVGLPIADGCVRPGYYFDARPETKKRFYSYEVAKKDPAAFARWWRHFIQEMSAIQQNVFMSDPKGVAPGILRPGSRGMLFESQVSINSLGFRGPEMSRHKRNAYRIVTIGGSTTFGITINSDDMPWPEALQQTINKQLPPPRRVQVINAGIPSYTLRLNLARLADEILPLKPDMIISYHGFNGFHWLVPTLPPIHGKPPPRYERRPLKLLADAEFQFKLMTYKLARGSSRPSLAVLAADPMENEYAHAYEELIEVARTNGVRLVLANYSMAANSHSDPDVVEFYRAGFPDVVSQIRANNMHSEIIENLVHRHPEICFVDTHPALDGQHDKFIDLVHFTQTGRDAIAQTMFNAIRPWLERDLDGREHQ